MPRHESLSLCPLLRSVNIQISPKPICYLCVQTLDSIDHVSLSFSSSPSFLSFFGPVEFVKAADIKVIAALGDSLTVGVVRWYFLCFTSKAVYVTSRKISTVWPFIRSEFAKSYWAVTYTVFMGWPKNVTGGRMDRYKIITLMTKCCSDKPITRLHTHNQAFCVFIRSSSGVVSFLCRRPSVPTLPLSSGFPLSFVMCHGGDRYHVWNQ